MKISCLTVADVSLNQKEQMFDLMATYYANVTWQQFLKDLSDKQWVLVLEESNKTIGFSTQKFFTHTHQGQEIGVVFSGDTVIDRLHRTSQVLAYAFGHFMCNINKRDPSRPLYWMLITKGIRTYRYLPLYFKEFYPRACAPTPEFYARLMTDLGLHLFPDRYDVNRGIVKAAASAQWLKEFDTPERDFFKKDFRYRYFYERNPGYYRGDELLCLARFDKAQIRPKVMHMIDSHPQEYALA